MAKHRKTNLLRETANPVPLREQTEWFRDHILEWAKEHGRDFPWRHTEDEYRIVVTEILLQQTTAAAVAKLYEPFFSQFPTWKALHEATPGDLRSAIGILGLGDQRTRRLKVLAAWVAENGWGLPSARDELEDVPGIGQYVASVLLAVKYGQPEPMLDVNMARVLERFFGARELADIRDDPWLQTVSRRLTVDRYDGWGVLDFAAQVCVARIPRCSLCSLGPRCQSSSSISLGTA